MRRLGLVVLVGVLAMTACGHVAGQAPVKPAGVTATDQAPTLTTEQRLGLENTVLRMRLLQQELQALGVALGQQVQAIEAAHPGWTVDLQAGQLVKKPAVAK